jgi:DNA-binding winged helix-turn-helix (wHTH) protein/tetratricopeptide (TPR) repeat protein
MPEPSRSPRVIRFGLYEADLAAGELRKDGSRVKLQERPFESLKILLERPGEVVTREEFRERLWPADTFVDFDHSLNASINKLRQALNDEADNPRFVATVGRRGYRFIAPVDGREAPPPPSPKAQTGGDAARGAPGAVTPSESPEGVPHSGFERWRTSLGVITFVSLALLAAFFLPRRRSEAALTDQDVVLVSEFVNTTGEPIFDDSLRQALTVKLSESPFFNLAPSEKIRETLTLMGRSPDERVVSPIDRDVCQRLGAKVLVRGSILSVGGKYVVTLRALACLMGDLLAKEEFDARSPDQVLGGLGRVLPGLRHTLGELLSSIQKFDTPIERATTPSLAALKAYAVGDQKRARGEETDAIPFYKMAIELDPEFAIAYARLGACYHNSQEESLAEDYLRKAFERREHVTAREKLYIAAHYYVDVTEQTEEAIQTYGLWRQIYPRDWIPANNLANEYIRIGRLENAVGAAREALRLNPNHRFPYVNLARAYKRSSRYAESKAICEHAIANHFDDVAIHELLYEIAFAEDDGTALEREAAWAKDRPEAAVVLVDEAMGAFALGEHRKAQALFQKARVALLAQDLKEYAALITLDEASFEAEFGHSLESRTALDRALRLAPIHDQAPVALVWARLGDGARAAALISEARRRSPVATVQNRYQLPAVEAAVFMSKNEPAAALEALQPAIPYDFATPDFDGLYYRGLASYQRGAYEDARAVLQKLLDNQGLTTVSPLWPLARLGLARTDAALGQADASRRAYDALFAFWKNADPDLPLLLQAKKEYRQLKPR